MINWRNGRATFVGASKYLIKGFFNFAHSITSESVDVVPDCVTSVNSLIDGAGLSVRSKIDHNGLSVECRIDVITSVDSLIDGLGISIRSKIDHRGLGVESSLCQ